MGRTVREESNGTFETIQMYNMLGQTDFLAFERWLAVGIFSWHFGALVSLRKAPSPLTHYPLLLTHFSSPSSGLSRATCGMLHGRLHLMPLAWPRPLHPLKHARLASSGTNTNCSMICSHKSGLLRQLPSTLQQGAQAPSCPRSGAGASALLPVECRCSLLDGPHGLQLAAMWPLGAL